MIDTDKDAGLTLLRDIKVTKVRWPESKAADEARFTQVVESAAAKATLSVTTERLSASLANAEREQKSLAGLKNDPPKIVFTSELAALLLYDGDPKWSDVEKSSYERALNTAFLVVRDKGSKTCYLSSGKLWYSAKEPLGPWQSIKTPPADLVQMLPKPDENDPVSSPPPAIVVATEPTELVVRDGEPKWTPVGEGALLFGKDIVWPTDLMVLKVKKGKNGKPPKIEQFMGEVSDYTWGPFQNVYGPMADPKYPDPKSQLDTTNLIEAEDDIYCENGY